MAGVFKKGVFDQNTYNATINYPSKNFSSGMTVFNSEIQLNQNGREPNANYLQVLWPDTGVNVTDNVLEFAEFIMIVPNENVACTVAVIVVLNGSPVKSARVAAVVPVSPLDSVHL
jgi:hypothetical protein